MCADAANSIGPLASREDFKPGILLVEDEAGVREVTGQVLESAGYHVWECSDAAQALRLARENPDRVALLLTDVVMPGMTGPELARELRQSCPDLITIFMSGYSDMETVRKAGPGPAVYLQKPFTMRVLLSRVSDALSKQAATASPELSSSLLA